MDPLHAVFANLDRWRHFPGYQLERRADIFFSVFLPEVLAKYTGIEIDPLIIPEFPIKRDLIWPTYKTNESVKVDYVLFSRDRSRAYFVELKTDAASRREAQDEYLAKARELGFKALLDGLVKIGHHTTARQKYYHLLHALENLAFLKLPEQLAGQLYPKSKSGIAKLLDEIVVQPVDPPIEVIYLQPNGSDSEAAISFQFFADCLECCAAPLAQLFREHLLRWRTPAGSSLPGT